MKHGVVLWIRHNHLPQALAVSTLGAVAVRAALLVINSDGGGVDVAPLWLGTAMTLPLLFTFSCEDSQDVVAPRPLLWRRAALLALTLGATALGAWLLTPASADGLGPMATWRNCCALLGLGLIGLGLVGSTALWLLPLTASLTSMMFAWPQYPGPLHGMVGFLRAPVDPHFSSGSWNLSIPVSAALAVAGMLVHTSGTRVAVHDGPALARFGSLTTIHGEATASTLAQGLGRVSRSRPLTVIAGFVCTWTLLASVGKWGGSPRLLLGNEVPSGAFIHAPLGALVGVVIGQTRWRTGVAVWQQLSGRPRWSLLLQECRRSIMATTTALGVPIGALALLSTATLATQSGVAVALSELAGGMTPTLLVLLEAGLLCVLGTVAGWFMRGIWIPALVMVLALAAMIPAPRVPVQDVDRIWAASYASTVCSPVPDLDVTVCTTPPLRGYLPAAVQSVADIYQRAPRREALPNRVLLTDRGAMGVSAPHSMDPTVSVRRSHGLQPPRELGPTTAESLTYSTLAWCPGANIGDLMMLWGQDDWTASPTMSRTIQALEECRG